MGWAIYRAENVFYFNCSVPGKYQGYVDCLNDDVIAAVGPNMRLKSRGFGIKNSPS